MLYRMPGNLSIDVEIRMNEEVPKTCYLSPFDLGVSCLRSIRKSLRGRA